MRDTALLHQLDVPTPTLEGYLFPDTYIFPEATTARGGGERDGAALRADLEAGVDRAARHDRDVAERRDGARLDRREGGEARRRSDR